ncbi:MAG: glycosyltransferase [Bacteroidales bacterium]|nr:glycosyltransferase [Bacteroidales bacterium]
MNNKVFLIGPNFHDFNQYVASAFQQLGWNVIVQAYDTPINPYSRFNKIRYKLSHQKNALKEKSRQLFSAQVRETFQQDAPQLVFILNGEMLTPEVMQTMHQSSSVALWLFDSITRLPYCWNILSECDGIFCYEKDDIPLIQERMAIDAEFLPQAVDSTAYCKEPEAKKYWDIVFAADLWSSSKRKQLIQSVVSHFPNRKIRVWGIYKPWYKGLWKSITRERRDIYTNRNASTAQLNLDYNHAKIVLNIHNEQQNNGANPKVYEIAATGSYQICDANPYIEELFPNGEIGLYHNEKELIEQINWALDPANEPEREARAKRAQEIVLSSHRFVDRIRQVTTSIKV